MPKILRSLLFAVLALVAGPVLAATAPADPVDAQIDRAMSKYPMFATLVEEVPDFRKLWHDRLQLAQLLKASPSQNDPAADVGMTLAMDHIAPYLLRSSDAATNEFLALFTQLFQEAAGNAAICTALLPGAGPSAVSAEEKAKAEAAMESKLFEPLLRAMDLVVQTGRQGEARTLPESDATNAVVPILVAIGEKHGADAIQTIANAEDKSLPAVKRCEAMAWFFEGILAQPEAERAMLMRTLWAAGQAGK